MGAPRSNRFAAQFVTLLQLQTCCYLAVPADSESYPETKPPTGSKFSGNRTKKSGSEKSGKSSQSEETKNRELEEESLKQIVEIRREKQNFELIKADIKTRNGQHEMKRRNVLDGKPRRPVKRPTTSSKNW